MGVIIVDRYIYQNMAGVEDEVFIDIEVRGEMSEMRDIFTLNLNRI